jgi:hypothetical protein
MLPQHVGALVEVGVPGIGAHRPVDALEVAEGSAVHVVPYHELLARTRELGDRRRRGRAAREGDSVAATLERGHRALQPLPGRVLRARVFVSARRTADALLPVGRGLVDRRRDRPGQLVGLGAGMDGEGVERIIVVHVGMIAPRAPG